MRSAIIRSTASDDARNDRGEPPRQIGRHIELPVVEPIDPQPPQRLQSIAGVVEPFGQLQRDLPRRPGVPRRAHGEHQRPAAVPRRAPCAPGRLSSSRPSRHASARSTQMRHSPISESCTHSGTRRSSAQRRWMDRPARKTPRSVRPNVVDVAGVDRTPLDCRPRLGLGFGHARTIRGNGPRGGGMRRRSSPLSLQLLQRIEPRAVEQAIMRQMSRAMIERNE